MKKITIEKEEGIADVIDRLLGEEDENVTLVVPTGSVLGRSVRNFHLLKREADAAGKNVVVESVDETILAFAKQSELEASHPLWRGVRGASNGMTDIIPVSGEEERSGGGAKKRGGKKKTAAAPVKLKVREEEEENDEVEEEVREEANEEERESEEAGSRFFKRRSPEESRGSYDEDDDEEGDGGGRSRGSGRLAKWTVGIVVVVLVALGVITWGFGRVTIAIAFQKTPWSYQANVTADPSVTQTAAGAAAVTIHAQVFTTQKNITQSFPATGNANVSLKAQGTITIYNAYSSAPQELVATTRFVTPDGKLFRLVSGVTVPGAQVTNGQIVPSSITAQVTADQAGDSYNVGPVDKLTIPGFQSSPKYDGFYGTLASGTSGGFIGKKAVPTAADIAAAKSKVSATLQSSLTSDLTASYPSGFKILSGATNVTVAKVTVNTSTDANGNFSVFGDATLQAIGFDETALKAYLLAQAQSTEASSTFSANTLTLNYGTPQANFTKGIISFPLSAQGSLEPIFVEGDFKASIAGKSMGDARAAIANIPQLANGTISAWPMWLWSIPSNPAKIQITTD